MSWKPEIETRGHEWTKNGTTFATKAEAESAGADIYGRWMMATGYRAVESDEPVNYRWVDGKGLQSVVDGEAVGEPHMMPARVVI